MIISKEDNISFEKGFYEREYEDIFPFRWMSKEAMFSISKENLFKYEYISFFLYSEFSDCSQNLSINLRDKTIASFALLPQWNYYSISLPDNLKNYQNQEKIELTLSLNKIFPPQYYPNDTRELGIRIARLELHNGEEKHANFLSFHKNAVLNIQETIEGKIDISSYPLSLGIDLYGGCNMKPPCVYCLWDDMKKLEGKSSEIVVDLQTLKDYGNFFNYAKNIINCSIGEPFLHPKFEEILDYIDNQQKFLEILTNGLVFTNRTIKALLGKKIFLYVSLDAATKETYAKIRNEHFDSIIPQLYLLNQERKKNGNLPKIYMIFMPMKVNKDDLEAFFKLCRDIEADFLVLRPLNYLENPEIERDRGGYHFNYEEEILSWEELKEIFNKCSELSKKYGVKVLNQFYFGSMPEPLQINKRDSNLNFISMQTEKTENNELPKENEDEMEGDLGNSKFPICREPWQSYYILRRGILPCCYGFPIAPMNDWATAWNSPVVKEMRKYLRKGRFSSYCLESLACPIVQRYCPKKEKIFILTNDIKIKKYASLRFINRVFFHLPSKIYYFLRNKF